MTIERFATSTWNSTTEPLILGSKLMETHDTASFFFHTPSHARFDFKPGQFVTLKVEIDGRIYGRSYSITSLPGDNVMQLTVKRVEGGVVSNWLIDQLMPHQKLWAYGIEGEFNAVDQHSKKKALLLSSGCGIAPVMSIALHLLQKQDEHVEDILFVYRAVNAESVIFLEKMVELEKKHPNFKVFLFLRDGDPNGILPENLPHITGTLTQESLEQISSDYHERSVFLCGSSSFMKHTKSVLENASFDMNHFHQESFTPTSLTGEPRPICVDDELLTVSVPKHGFENKEVENGSLLIDTLTEGELPIVAACYSGLCGACVCKVTKGKVESTSTGPLNSRQIEEGYVVACCSHVIEDVEIDI